LANHVGGWQDGAGRVFEKLLKHLFVQGVESPDVWQGECFRDVQQGKRWRQQVVNWFSKVTEGSNNLI